MMNAPNNSYPVEIVLISSFLLSRRAKNKQRLSEFIQFDPPAVRQFATVTFDADLAPQ